MNLSKVPARFVQIFVHTFLATVLLFLITFVLCSITSFLTFCNCLCCVCSTLRCPLISSLRQDLFLSFPNPCFNANLSSKFPSLHFFSLIGLCPDLFIYLLQMTDQAMFSHMFSSRGNFSSHNQSQNHSIVFFPQFIYTMCKKIHSWHVLLFIFRPLLLPGPIRKKDLAH